MKKILIVGGQEAFTKTWAKKHLSDVGLEMHWFWNYERRNFPDFPRSADAVIVLKEMCGHRHRKKAIHQAKRWGIPFAEVSRQWLRALPILEEKGIVSAPPIQPTNIEDNPMTPTPITYEQEQTAEHPDWSDYLEILLLEYDNPENPPTAKEVIERMTNLIEPYPMTEPIVKSIRTKINRMQLASAKPQPPLPQPPSKEIKVSNYFIASMLKANDIVKTLTSEEVTTIVKFVGKCAEKKKPNVPSAVRTIFIEQKVDNPTLFSGVIYHLFNEYKCTTSPETVNKAYERVTGRKHNYTKPREVFAHYKCKWTVFDATNLDLSFRTLKPLKEPKKVVEELIENSHNASESSDLSKELGTLKEMVRDLMGTVQELRKENLQLHEKIKAVKSNSSEDDCIVIPKSELIDYIINNKLNITIK